MKAFFFLHARSTGFSFPVDRGWETGWEDPGAVRPFRQLRWRHFSIAVKAFASGKIDKPLPYLLSRTHTHSHIHTLSLFLPLSLSLSPSLSLSFPHYPRLINSHTYHFYVLHHTHTHSQSGKSSTILEVVWPRTNTTHTHTHTHTHYNGDRLPFWDPSFFWSQ